MTNNNNNNTMKFGYKCKCGEEVSTTESRSEKHFLSNWLKLSSFLAGLEKY